MFLDKKSKKIISEVIHPALQNHAAPGKRHDLPDLRPIIPAIAMDMAFFAGRFRLQRAVAPLCQGMAGYFRAFVTEKCLLHGYVFNLNIRFDLIAMFCPAVYPDEVEHEFQILNLCAGKLIHGCIIGEKIKGMYDAGQKKPFPTSLCFSRQDMLR